MGSKAILHTQDVAGHRGLQRGERAGLLHQRAAPHTGPVGGGLRREHVLARCVRRWWPRFLQTLGQWRVALRVSGQLRVAWQRRRPSWVSTSSCADIRTIELWRMTLLTWRFSRSACPTDQCWASCPLAKARATLLCLPPSMRSSTSLTTCSWSAAIMAPRRN
jgi:hypothetical protein